MKDFSWIYMLIFVFLPMLKSILESRSRKKKAAAKQLATRSAKDLQRSARIRTEQRGFSEPLSDPLSEAELTEAELEEDVQAWIEVQPGSTSPTAPAPTPLGGGWVEVSDPIRGAPTSVPTHSPPHPAMRLEPRSHLDPPQDPLELLAQLRQQRMDTSRSSRETEDRYSRVKERSSANSWSGPGISSVTAAARGRRKKQRLTLTRNQLRDRLLWREILGPPVSLRPPDEMHL
jgi:hypothetical protein